MTPHGHTQGGRRLQDENGRPTAAAMEELRHVSDDRPAFLSVYADVTTGEWEAILKGQAEAIRAELGDDLAGAVRFHEAFDAAFLEVDALSGTDAQGVAVFVSPLHHLHVAYALPRAMDTRMTMGRGCDVDVLENALR